MFCPECGAEIPDDSKHCKECGANLTEKESKETPAQKNKEKMKFNKKWLVGCCIGLIVIFLIFAVIGNTNNSKQSDNMTEEQFKGNCSAIDFNLLNKNADNHTGEKLKFTGKILQISENSNGGYIRLGVNGSYSDVVYVDYKGTNNFVEGDTITVYGVCKGDYSYTSTIGAKITLPKIDAKYIE